MTDDWMRPITTPLPGPVAAEALQLTADERARIAAIAELIAEPVRLPLGGRPQERDSLASTTDLSNRRGHDASA